MLRRATATSIHSATKHNPPTNAEVPVRKSRLRRRSSSSNSLPATSRNRRRPVVVVCGVILCLWMTVVGFFLQTLQREASKLSKQQHQSPTSTWSSWWRSSSGDKWSLRGAFGRSQSVSRVVEPSQPAASESELVDMRQLSRELPFDNPDGGVWRQGWELQPRAYSRAQPLTVLVVPHSHCDPGWIKTFDEYFRQQTSSIITTVITSLLKNPKRTFIWAEISYFAWWWDDQDESMRANVRTLLQNRQFEFVTGGWVQPDEANSELYAMEIQLQEGHDWIRQHLGEEFIPKYSWSIDPFGYSPTMAYLLKKYGFRGMLIQRVHYAVKKELAKRRHLEFYWRQTWGGTENDIFTHLMPFFSYDTPHTCGPDPSVCCQFDFHRSPVGTGPGCPWQKPPVAITEANVKERATLALDQYLKKASLYRGDVVLIPLGDDFRYQTTHEAELQYTNHQRIHDYINEHVPGVTIKFGTLSEYFDLTIGQFAPPVLKGSFFTYADVDQDYWSGYFTSRVFDKALDRQLERVLYAASALGGNKTELQDPRRSLSLFQHHDGVTGTAKNHVVEDYARRMHDAVRFTQRWMLERLQQKFPQEVAAVPAIKPCIVSTAPRSVGQNLCSMLAVVFNPLDTPQNCGPVVVPAHQGRVADLPCEVPGPASKSNTKFVFDEKTGLMKEPVREQWKVWRVNDGGAYLFFPGKLYSYETLNVKLQNGGLVEERRIKEGGFVVETEKWKRTVIEKVVPNEFGTKSIVLDFIFEVDLDRDNEEWFVRFENDISNEGISHTDLNGFNFDTHKFRSDMPIQSQVFPMPTLASIQDSKLRMTVMSEHAQGTASLQDGSIDVWLDRRLSQDDSRGLGQGVQDNRPTRTRLRVVLETEGYDRSGEFRITKLNRRMWQELQHPLEMFGTHTVGSSPALPENLEAAERRRELVRQQAAQRKGWKSHRSLNETSRKVSGGIISRISNGLSLALQRFSRVRPLSTVFGRKQAEYSGSAKIPFVFMVHKRVEYMKKAIDSLRKSDFPKSQVPIIVSHDGRVPEMVRYVDSLKSEFQVIQLFHPHACYDHPHSFPGNDTSLNVGFQGDMFGNPREAWVTCAKHHFTWLLKTVFEDLRIPREGSEADDTSPESDMVDTFLFLEEDYIVGPTIYTALTEGLKLTQQYEGKADGGFLGVGLDPTHGGSKYEPSTKDDEWFVEAFHSGPMTLNRKVYQKLRDYASEYCRFDDYNWDWSLVHVQSLGHLPHTLLLPARTLAKHIGVAEGMHAKESKFHQAFGYGPRAESLTTRFAGTRLRFNQAKVNPLRERPGYGGWSHPADQQHCMKLLTSEYKATL